MGKGEAALVEPVPGTPSDGPIKVIDKKGKDSKKAKKDKKEKSAKKDKKKRDSTTLEVDPIAPSPAKKAKFDSSIGNPSTTNQVVDDEGEDTNIALGQVVDRASTSNDVDAFNMSQTTVAALKEKGFKSLFDIQAATFRLLRFEKKDVIGRARTGSGKTLAFVLPIIEALASESLPRKHPPHEKPLVLCLAPTRELAQQVHRDFEWISSAHSYTSGCFTGGTMKGPQKGQLRRGLDILVGTPGRIIDLLDEQCLSLAGVRYIVLDEADEMLSMGFQDAVERILGECTSPEMKQTLLFSATIPRWVKDLARKYMREDATVTVDTVSDSKNRTNSDITHLAMACPPTERGDTIADVVKVYTGALGKTIIFTDTKAEANEVSAHEKLVNALGGVGVLHGDIPQGQREATLAAYREGKVRVLVATDVAARGLDIKDVDLILQTHPPTNYETYIHRSGRTGRAGKSGTCCMFYSTREKYMVGLIEHRAGIKFKRANAPQPSDIVRASVSDTVMKISSVHSDNLKLFREVARKVVESYQGEEDAAEKALAASLACMAGYTDERFKMRSLLSCFQGFVAVVLSSSHPFESSGHAWSVVRRLVGQELAAEMKGMQVCKDKTKAVFDVPQASLDIIEATGSTLSNGYSLTVPKDELPEMDEGQFDLHSATQQLNERRQMWRGKRGGGGGWGGRGGGGRGGGGGWGGRGGGGRGGGRGGGWGGGSRGGWR